MKKKIALLLCAMLMLASALTACGNGNTESTSITATLDIVGGVLKTSIGQADENGVFTVPEGVFEIGEGAFSNDITIKKVIINKNVKKINTMAFYGNTTVEEVVFEEGSRLTFIGGGAFIGCTSLKKIILPDSVEDIGPYAFFMCTSLESIHIPDGIEDIYSYTFGRCDALLSIALPSGLKRLGKAAFMQCASLTSVDFPNSLEEIGEAVFSNCDKLSAVDLSDTSLRVLGDSAFFSAKSLTSAYLPTTLEYIGEQAFYVCSKLVTLNVPKSVKDIGTLAFGFTPWFASLSADYEIVGDGILIKTNVRPEELELSGKGIKVIGAATFWDVLNGASASDLAEYGGDSGGYKYAAELKSITVPEGVVSIGDNAFLGCSLEHITLPTTLTHIGESAFNEVLTEGDGVDLSVLASLETIEDYAFANCTAVDEVVLSASVKDVGQGAFYRTAAMEAFVGDYRDKNSDTAEFWISGDGVLLLAAIPSGATEISVPDGVKVIAGSALAGWDSSVLYNSNEGIADKYLYNAWNLDRVEKITLPEGLVNICDGAFRKASSLKSINIPDSVERIGDEAFYYCGSLLSIALGKNTEYIGDFAFIGSGLTEFNAELSALEHIGDYAFRSCGKLVYLVLPADIDEVGSNLVLDCSNFENIVLSEELAPRIYEIIGNDLYASATRKTFNISYYT